MFFKEFFILGFIFGVFAFGMAFFIAYEIHQRQKYTGKTLFKKTFDIAIFAFFFFWILSLVVSVLLEHSMKR